MASAEGPHLVGADIPETVPFGRLREVCDLLDLPADRVRAVAWDCMDAITVTLYLLDPDGKKVVQGDDALTYEARILFEEREARAERYFREHECPSAGPCRCAQPPDART